MAQKYRSGRADVPKAGNSPAKERDGSVESTTTELSTNPESRTGSGAFGSSRKEERQTLGGARVVELES